MKKRLLRIMLKAFTSWLHEEFHPAGKAAIYTLTVRADLLIQAIPDRSGPEVTLLQRLDEESLEAGLNWLLTALMAAYPDDWAPIAVESMRLLLHRNVEAITALAQPPAPAMQPVEVPQ